MAAVRTDMALGYATAVVSGSKASGRAFGIDNCALGVRACRVEEGKS
jgi:hypothetical protein